VTARDRDAGGAGLGLAIVRALVEAHGGGIQAASAGRARGSRFTVTLPAIIDEL
jgi:signal transduction histidine kinase